MAHRFRNGMIVGGAAGYVLGARAGRERYEQIARAWKRFREAPQVRRAAGELGDRAREGMERVRHARDGRSYAKPSIPQGREAEYANIAGPGVNP